MVSQLSTVLPTSASLHVVRRNLKVWRKLMVASLLGNFAEPLLYLAAIGYGLGRFVGDMGGLPYTLFLATGIICSTAMNTASFEGMYSAYTRMAVQNTWSSLLTTPLKVSDVVFGELLWIGLKSTINGTCILLVMVGLGLISFTSIFPVIPILFLTGLCFGSMALIMTSMSKGYDFFVYYFTLVVTPMMLLSGVFFPLETLPEAIKWVMQILPLSHIVEVVRPTLIEQPVTGLLGHLGVVLAYTFVCYVVATRRIFLRLMN